jgi:hypothetical protein
MEVVLMPEMVIDLVMKESSVMYIVLLGFDKVGEGSFSFLLQNLIRQLCHHQTG